jgi:hypothetical protein
MLNGSPSRREMPNNPLLCCCCFLPNGAHPDLDGSQRSHDVDLQHQPRNRACLTEMYTRSKTGKEIVERSEIVCQHCERASRFFVYQQSNHHW